MTNPTQLIESWSGREIVIDCVSQYVVIGTYVDQDHKYVRLVDVDFHDLRDSSTSRELYLVDAKRHGNRPTRNQLLVRQEEIVGISLLDDVIA